MCPLVEITYETGQNRKIRTLSLICVGAVLQTLHGSVLLVLITTP